MLKFKILCQEILKSILFLLEKDKCVETFLNPYKVRFDNTSPIKVYQIEKKTNQNIINFTVMDVNCKKEFEVFLPIFMEKNILPIVIFNCEKASKEETYDEEVGKWIDIALENGATNISLINYNKSPSNATRANLEAILKPHVNQYGVNFSKTMISEIDKIQIDFLSRQLKDTVRLSQTDKILDLVLKTSDLVLTNFETVWENTENLRLLYDNNKEKPTNINSANNFTFLGHFLFDNNPIQETKLLINVEKIGILLHNIVNKKSQFGSLKSANLHSLNLDSLYDNGTFELTSWNKLLKDKIDQELLEQLLQNNHLAFKKREHIILPIISTEKEKLVENLNSRKIEFKFLVTTNDESLLLREIYLKLVEEVFEQCNDVKVSKTLTFGYRKDGKITVEKVGSLRKQNLGIEIKLQFSNLETNSLEQNLLQNLKETTEWIVKLYDYKTKNYNNINIDMVCTHCIMESKYPPKTSRFSKELEKYDKYCYCSSSLNRQSSTNNNNESNLPATNQEKIPFSFVHLYHITKG